MPYGIDFIEEVLSASQCGEGLSPDRVAELSVHLSRLVAGESFDDAFDVGPGWRKNVRSDLRGTAYSESDDRSATQWLAELLRYRAAHYDEDLIAPTKPRGRRGRLFAAILAAGGRVPSLRSIQRFRADARQLDSRDGAATQANRRSETNDRS